MKSLIFLAFTAVVLQAVLGAPSDLPKPRSTVSMMGDGLAMPNPMDNNPADTEQIEPSNHDDEDEEDKQYDAEDYDYGTDYDEDYAQDPKLKKTTPKPESESESSDDDEDDDEQVVAQPGDDDDEDEDDEDEDEDDEDVDDDDEDDEDDEEEDIDPVKEGFRLVKDRTKDEDDDEEDDETTYTKKEMVPARRKQKEGREPDDENEEDDEDDDYSYNPKKVRKYSPLRAAWREEMSKNIRHMQQGPAVQEGMFQGDIESQGIRLHSQLVHGKKNRPSDKLRTRNQRFKF